MLYWDQLVYPYRKRANSTEIKTKSDTRSPFKKDFDTVCNSSVLRRLQDKAQVFPLEVEDYARTRLTHSIEVMTIAESLAIPAVEVIKTDIKEYLHKDWNKGKKYTDVRKWVDDIPIILKAAALLHDMGNPPFGHLGEQIISDWFQNDLPRIVETGNAKTGFQYAFENASKDNSSILSNKLKGEMANDLTHFEGNAQLLRLVTKLCYATDENGMNLSYPIIATFIKYPCSSSNMNKAVLSKKKPGFFFAEKDVFDDVEKKLGLNNCRHPLAFLLEAADDIAYLSADIEDAQKKGIVSISMLESYLRKKEEDPMVKNVIDRIDHYRNEASRINYPDIDDYIIHRTRVLIKGIMIDAVQTAFVENYKAIMEGTFECELLEKSAAKELMNVLRTIERERIYYCQSIVESKTRAFTIIEKLLSTYVMAVLNYSEGDKGKDSSNNLLYSSLSKNYRFVCENAIGKEIDLNEKIYHKLLLVTDQIAGMTDTHAMVVYNTTLAIS